MTYDNLDFLTGSLSLDHLDRYESTDVGMGLWEYRDLFDSGVDGTDYDAYGTSYAGEHVAPDLQFNTDSYEYQQSLCM